MNTNFEEAIKNRLETGFKNWNSGYESWLEWCNTLYEPDALYNVHGMHWTLQEYKDAMGQLFAESDIELGEFYNMIIKDDWCAIRYNVITTNKKTGARVESQSMEFVHFKDNPNPIGVRVIEGWAISTETLSVK